METTHYRLGTRNHLLLTPTLILRGVIDPCPVRLADHLRNFSRPEIILRDVELRGFGGGGPLPETRDRVHIARPHIVAAHEYVDLGSDPHLRHMHQADPRVSVRAHLLAFPGGSILGLVSNAQIETEFGFLTIHDPVSTLPGPSDLADALRGLPYLLVQRAQISALAFTD